MRNTFLVSLTSLLTRNRNFDFKDVNALGAERIARIAAENGVSNFIQVSHLNAAEDSASKFYSTKGEGEREAGRPANGIEPTSTCAKRSAAFWSSSFAVPHLMGSRTSDSVRA